MSLLRGGATSPQGVVRGHHKALNCHNGLIALILIAVRDVACMGISNAALTKVDRHRIAWSVVAYQLSRQMQFFAMTFT